MDRMRRRCAWGSRAVLDSAEDLASHYAREALLTPGGVETIEAHAEKIMAVTREEVRDVARLITRPARLTVVVSGPHPRERTAVRDAVTRWTEHRA
jgi:predicted Zn-dependent peptidase